MNSDSVGTRRPRVERSPHHGIGRGAFDGHGLVTDAVVRAAREDGCVRFWVRVDTRDRPGVTSY